MAAVGRISTVLPLILLVAVTTAAGEAPEAGDQSRLWAAATEGSCEVVEELLACGAECGVDVDAADDDGETALTRAAMAVPVLSNRLSTFLQAVGEIPRQQSVIDQREQRKELIARFECTVAAIVERSPDLNAVDREWGNSALHDAARSHIPANVELLVARGADVRLRNKAGRTPLQEAKGQAPKNQEIIQLLKRAEKAAKKRR